MSAEGRFVLCPMCGSACACNEVEPDALTLGFVCLAPRCAARGVTFTPHDFDAESFIEEWGA